MGNFVGAVFTVAVGTIVGMFAFHKIMHHLHQHKHGFHSHGNEHHHMMHH